MRHLWSFRGLEEFFKVAMVTGDWCSIKAAIAVKQSLQRASGEKLYAFFLHKNKSLILKSIKGLKAVVCTWKQPQLAITSKISFAPWGNILLTSIIKEQKKKGRKG